MLLLGARGADLARSRVCVFRRETHVSRAADRRGVDPRYPVLETRPLAGAQSNIRIIKKPDSFQNPARFTARNIELRVIHGPGPLDGALLPFDGSSPPKRRAHVSFPVPVFICAHSERIIVFFRSLLSAPKTRKAGTLLSSGPLLRIWKTLRGRSSARDRSGGRGLRRPAGTRRSSLHVLASRDMFSWSSRFDSLDTQVLILNTNTVNAFVINFFDSISI